MEEQVVLELTKNEKYALDLIIKVIKDTPTGLEDLVEWAADDDVEQDMIEDAFYSLMNKL